jgi:hypothetical protein
MTLLFISNVAIRIGSEEMITDKNGNEVKEGDIIEFGNSGIPYKIVSTNGLLGAYEDGEYIPLKDVLKNFLIIS